MGSAVLTNASGSPFPLISGNFFSGVAAPHPIGGVQMRADPSNSGFAYVYLSGGGTLTSGGFFLSGVNVTDGMILAPGDSYFVPKACLTLSGTVNIFVRTDATGSGRDKAWFEFL